MPVARHQEGGGRRRCERASQSRSDNCCFQSVSAAISDGLAAGDCDRRAAVIPGTPAEPGQVTGLRTNWLAALPETARKDLAAALSPAEARALLYDWAFWARPAQLPPAGNRRGGGVSSPRRGAATPHPP